MTKQKQTTAQLQKLGFIKVKGFKFLFINDKGEALNKYTGKYYKPDNRNDIKPERKRQSLPKLILNTFARQPIRSGQITYLDGNRSNLAASNLKYSRIFEPSTKSPVNQSDLMTAIRCYFRVPKDYKTKDLILTRIYMQNIIENRAYFVTHAKTKNIEVFKHYISGYGKTNVTTAKEFKVTPRDVNIIVNQNLNTLIDEILQDMIKGLFKMQDFKPKETTQTDILKKMNIDRLANGLHPLPLRKLSQKEQDKRAIEKIKAFQEQSRKLIEKPP